MNRIQIALAAGVLTLAGVGTAAAQTVIIDGGYAPPAYVVAPAPTYMVPVAPPTVYVGPNYAAPAYVAPTYVAPAVPVRRWHRDVVVTERPAWGGGPVYTDW